MEKPGGSVYLTLLLGAGVLLHSGVGRYAAPAPPPSGAQQTSVTAPVTQAQSARKGPWTASCDYWRPQRPPSLDPPSANTNQTDADCTPQSWGLPPRVARESTDAHSVIAIVPDPVHSHLAAEFDRTLDVLIGAASNNGYLMSYSWLPWRPPLKTETGSEQIDDREPGLLIFDKHSASGETIAILYMFLVSEMPSAGIQPEQLKRALRYQLALRAQLGSYFATDFQRNLRVIGPQYSGSAMSLNLSINSVLMDGSINSGPQPVQSRVIIGTTSTKAAWHTLLNEGPSVSEDCRPAPDARKNEPAVSYASLASDQAVSQLAVQVQKDGYRPAQAIVLAEDGTLYGKDSGPDNANGKDSGSDNANGKDSGKCKPIGGNDGGKGKAILIPFPREIASLRNSYNDGEGATPTADATPSPYLHLSTHDDGPKDTLPDFSASVTPLSQEAQLMAISRMLTQLRAKYADVVASNPLDALFLAKSLHRSNPDTRLILEPDLLLQRDSDDAPYIGSLAYTPYPLMWLARSTKPGDTLRPFASAEMQAYYNAANYTLAHLAKPDKTEQSTDPATDLYGHRATFPLTACASQPGLNCPRLWLTAVGSDGYYPIALLDASSEIMGVPSAAVYRGFETLYPSDFWQALCVLVSLACLMHIAAVSSASYQSVQTCDLEMKENCSPHRRALYTQIGAASLFLMSAIVSLPVASFVQNQYFRLTAGNRFLAIVTFILGAAGWVLAVVRTWRGLRKPVDSARHFLGLSEAKFCSLLYLGAMLATLVLTGMWIGLCIRSVDDQQVGLFFSYRCLHPLSGVSPLAPALLLLVGWFSWAVMHTRRLRFTRQSRPRLPDAPKVTAVYDRDRPANFASLFVADTRLCDEVLEDTTCLMISRRVLQKIVKAHPQPGGEPYSQRAFWLDGFLTVLLLGLTCGWIFEGPIRTLDHFGYTAGATTLYECFIGLLLAPLLVLALCAAARLFLVSASLREQLLEPLERMPLRHAFTRLEGYSWVGMLRESGQLERWRDMARSTEAIRQIAHDKTPTATRHANLLRSQYRGLESDVASLQEHIKVLREGKPQIGTPLPACGLMEKIEWDYAACAEHVLTLILVPHWLHDTHDLLERTVATDAQKPLEKQQELILLAEEFLAIRYVAFIRAILAQMRYLLLFITTALVLVILAINSYPFQPRRELDWCVTVVFFTFLAGMVFVFAQMHRNPLLNRITNTTAHGLGMDFYLRIAGFGSLPLFTWLATQYPSVGGALYGILRPGLDAFK